VLKRTAKGGLDMENPNRAQADYWSSATGKKWISHETRLDAAMAEILHRLLERSEIKPGQNVLDIGCGTGASTLEAAKLVGKNGHVTALDIATQLLNRAESRSDEMGLTNTSFLLADAQSHQFELKQYDTIMSRFGLMFFADPVAAFSNIANGLKDAGRMVFAAWGPVAQNPWFYVPRDAAVAQLGKPAPADPLAPSPLAFQDLGKVIDLMKRAGLTDVTGETEMVAMNPIGTAADAARVASRVGPAARVMKEFSGNESDAMAIEKSVADAFSEFVTGGGVRMAVSINYFSASPLN
jgi:ubiquinone/menaquinone biosynthesis C-methylase UbiE